jgi:aldehyde:ferredoxin oxidoreductase
MKGNIKMTKFGYAGKILRVNLSNNQVTETSTFDYADRFLGGRGLAAKIYWDEVQPETGAFDEENRLIFALGPMAGVSPLGASRWGVFGKSPLTTPDKFCYGNLGGRWGAELKFAGYDGIVVHGKSEKPVYLLISDGKVQLKDAATLWGKGAIQTRNILKEELGKKVRVVAIGPAGENTVSTATLLADNNASGSGGLGAVMGAKKLKAIVVKRVSKEIQIAHPDRLRELTKYIMGLGKDNVPVWGMDFMVYGSKVKKEPCFGCLGNCLRIKYTADNGKTGKYMCQSRFFYYAWALGYYGEENDASFHAEQVCDEYGLDTWTLQSLLEWLCECFNAGVLTEEETGIPISKIGSVEFIEKVVKMISLREGFGDILAKGRDKAAEEIGPEAKALVKHADAYEPRMYITNALIFPFEPREPIQQVHEVGLTLAQWSSWEKGTKGAYISTDVLRQIARQFWGGEAAADFSSYEGKALAAKMIVDRNYVKETLMLCDWFYPMLDIRNSEDHMGDPTIESKILSAVIGKEFDEESLNRVGERVFNLQRAILLREGHKALDDDKLPDSWHNTPYEGHIVDPDSSVPGKNGEIISRNGAKVDWEDFEQMRADYYQLRRWDVATGLQTRKQLTEIGLEDIADDLEQRGLLA